VNDGVRGHNAEGSRVSVHHLEFDRAQATSHKEDVVFVHRFVSSQKERLEKPIKEVSVKKKELDNVSQITCNILCDDEYFMINKILHILNVTNFI